MDSSNVNPTYPVDVTNVNKKSTTIDKVLNSNKSLVLSEWAVPSHDSLVNHGAGIPYTPRIGINQAIRFDEDDKVTSFRGYFPFHMDAVLYFHAPSRDPTFTPPTNDYMLNIARNSILPMVVRQDAAGVYYEIPHMVVARFEVFSNGIIVDCNDAPIIELFTMCCDSQEARFDQMSHLKVIDGDLRLLAGVMIQDWSQCRWYTILMSCYERVNHVGDQDDCVAKWEAN